MKRLLIAIAVAGLASGCIVRSPPPGHRRGAVVASCPPNHHWDGKHCKKDKKPKHWK